MERPNALSIPPALQAKATEVVKLLSQGNTNKQEIIFAVWGVRPGRSEKYHQAEEEYTQIMKFLGGLYATT
jgi:hypothetical protein